MSLFILIAIYIFSVVECISHVNLNQRKQKRNVLHSQLIVPTIRLDNKSSYPLIFSYVKS